MIAVIVYGSLIHRGELDRRGRLRDAVPVFISGYKRIFNQEPSWRADDSDCRAVLNVTESASARFNGLWVVVKDPEDLGWLDERERGYNRVEVDPSQVEPFGDAGRADTSSQLDASAQIYMYVGRKEKRNSSLLPNREYLELCMDGARQWGEIFFEEFLRTTYVQGKDLVSYLGRGRLS